jgi:hypothetical protein
MHHGMGQINVHRISGGNHRGERLNGRARRENPKCDKSDKKI